MANIFDTSDVSDQAQSALTPKQGAAAPRAAEEQSDFAAFLGVAETVLEVGADLYDSSQKRIAADQDNGAVASFAQSQLDVAEAVSQGALSTENARRRMRANYKAAIGSNPALVADLGKVHKDIINTAGLGKIVEEGTAEAQEAASRHKKASDAGWVKPSMSEAEATKQTNLYFEHQRALEDLTHLQKKATLQSTELGIKKTTQSIATGAITQETAQHNLNQLEKKVMSQAALGKVSNTFIEKMKSDYTEIGKQLATGKITQEEAIIQADQIFASLQQVSTQIGGDAGSDYVANMTAPMKTIHEMFSKQFSGELTVELAQTNINKAMALQKLLLLGNPRIAQVVAISALVPNAQLSLIPAVNDVVADYLLKNSVSPSEKKKPKDVVVDTQEDAKDLDTYLDLTRQNMISVMGEARAGLIKPEQQLEQLNANVVNILRSTVINGKATENPTEFNQVMEFFGSTEFGNYTTKVGGIPAEVTAQAAEVLYENYQRFVNELMVKEYKDKVVYIKPHIKLGGSARTPRINTDTQVPISEVVTAQPSVSVTPLSDVDVPITEAHDGSQVIAPMFNGAGVTFVLDEAQIAPEQLPVVKAQVEQLNKNVAPILNQSVRAAAHLAGHKNYQKVFDTNFAAIFSEESRAEFKDTLPKTSPTKPQITSGTNPSPFVSASAAKKNANLPDIPEAVGILQNSVYFDYNNVLGQSESSGSYNEENSLGYIGKYQWGSEALQDLGYVTFGIGAANSKLNDSSNWTGRGGINSKKEFMESPKAQEKAIIRWNRMLDRRMKGAGILKYVGQTMNGIPLTQDGLRSAVHLLGKGKVIRSLKAGNLRKYKDKNGVSAWDYIKKHNSQ